jgi:hypothetical protein
VRVRAARRGRLLVFGFVGQSPFAGVAWQGLHYLEGLRRLGYDVFYVEDTQEWPYDPEQDAKTDDPRFTLRYLDRLMTWAGFGDRWAYRAAVRGDAVLGPAAPRFRDLVASADGLVNLTGTTVLREEYLGVPVRIYLETDPVQPQIDVAEGRFVERLGAHTHHFTFGENVGAPDCGVPVGRFPYRATRQPVVLDWWDGPGAGGSSGAAASEPAAFTTVANWRQSGKDIWWQGELYTWSKHHEFLKFLDLPRRTAEPLELALSSCEADDRAQLLRHGWRVRDALALSRDLQPYRDYLRGSRGEFTVAKDQNIRLWTGWFSDRSACYLAAGRPVLTQETGFSKLLPTGKGLFGFRTMEEILEALDLVASDYAGHCRAAGEIAAAYFAADVVLRRLCDEAGL